MFENKQKKRDRTPDRALPEPGSRFLLGSRWLRTSRIHHRQAPECRLLRRNGVPLVYLQRGGTWHGLAFAEQWPANSNTYLPYRPVFGASAVNARITTMQGYVDHYDALFDAMGLDRFHLVGFFFGGRRPAEFAA